MNDVIELEELLTATFTDSEINEEGAMQLSSHVFSIIKCGNRICEELKVPKCGSSKH